MSERSRESGSTARGRQWHRCCCRFMFDLDLFTGCKARL